MKWKRDTDFSMKSRMDWSVEWSENESEKESE